MYVIFSVKRECVNKIDTVLQDDIVSRQSIVIRDAQALGFDKNVRFVLIEGAAAALQRAEELFKEIAEKEPDVDAQKIYSKFKEQDETVDVGMGLLFQ